MPNVTINWAFVRELEERKRARRREIDQRRRAAQSDGVGQAESEFSKDKTLYDHLIED